MVVVAFRRTIGILAYARLHEELEFVRLRSLIGHSREKSFVVILAWFAMVCLVLILGQEEKRQNMPLKITELPLKMIIFFLAINYMPF